MLKPDVRETVKGVGYDAAENCDAGSETDRQADGATERNREERTDIIHNF